MKEENCAACEMGVPRIKSIETRMSSTVLEKKGKYAFPYQDLGAGIYHEVGEANTIRIFFNDNSCNAGSTV